MNLDKILLLLFSYTNIVVSFSSSSLPIKVICWGMPVFACPDNSVPTSSQ